MAGPTPNIVPEPKGPTPDPAKETPTHTPAQTQMELASVTNATIPQGKGEPPARLTLTLPPEVQEWKSDSPDPVRIKDQMVTATKNYLKLDEITPIPPAVDDPVRVEMLANIKNLFGQLREAMALARGENHQLTTVRAQFEKFIGVKATSGQWAQGHNGLNKMCTQAKLMILEEKTKATVNAKTVDDKLRELVAAEPQFGVELGKKLGTAINVGFAGAVGKEFDSVLAALTNGSMVQKCQTLNAFAENWMSAAVKANDPGVMARIRANIETTQREMAEQAKKQGTAAPADFNLAGRLENMKEFGAFKGLAASPGFQDTMFGKKNEEGKREGGLKKDNAGVDAERAQAGKLDGKGLGGDMDTKMAQQPVERLEEHELDFLASQGSPTVDFSEATKEKIPDDKDRKAKKVELLKAAGIHLSKAPGTQDGKTDGVAMPAQSPGNPKDNNAGMVDATSVVPDPDRAVKDKITVNDGKDGKPGKDMAYIEGKAENIVDPLHSWIAEARAACAPLKAGISGTTARFAGAAQMLGATKGEAVVAMLGHLQAIEAHSFWEIVDGAQLGMTPGTYTPFSAHPEGMEAAGAEFVKNHMELGPDDAEMKKKAILGQK